MKKKSPPFGSPKEGRSFPYYIVSNTYSSSKEALASPMKLSSLYSFPAFEKRNTTGLYDHCYHTMWDGTPDSFIIINGLCLKNQVKHKSVLVNFPLKNAVFFD